MKSKMRVVYFSTFATALVHKVLKKKDGVIIGNRVKIPDSTRCCKLFNILSGNLMPLFANPDLPVRMGRPPERE